ncbi:CPBP family intramembrane glutamic endopeptidase [Methanosarcina mazei]|uniref:CPBP family intramembrane glutamic endopeptidase n=1 Tax=Methanosarcina mazei TaxID=2209 RepID=UPI0006976E02|nr:CPBP family intramembrane glutamic endopeptidase [Methanosarcina mazei]
MKMESSELFIEKMENTNYLKAENKQSGRLEALYLKSKGIYVGIPILAIIFAEALILLGRADVALWIHIATLVGLFLATTFTERKELFITCQALMLLPLLRLLNLSMPIFFDFTLYALIFIYATMAIPVVMVIIYQGLTYDEIGATFRRIWLYFPLSVLMGYGLATGEYYIIWTESLIPTPSLPDLLIITVVMVLFVGLVEEIIFRSILQTRLNKLIGIREGILLSAILYGFMHSGYGDYYLILYTSFIGVIIGYIFYKTQSLPLIVLIHGFVNVFLFGIFPYLGPGLGLL